MKKIIVLVMALCVCISLFGCAKEDSFNGNASELEDMMSALKEEKSKFDNDIKDEIEDIKNNTEKYIVTFNIKQKHFTLDIGQHLKDEMNDISIQIPVDKEYYDSVEVGDTIVDDFRVGSFIFKGSFGNWKVTVEDKSIQ